MLHFLTSLTPLIAVRAINDDPERGEQVDEECPVSAHSETERLIDCDSRCSTWRSISPYESAVPSMEIEDPIHDCLGLSLEYLGSGSDLESFRMTSKEFNKIHAQYQRHRDTIFNNFGVLFEEDSQQNKYRSVEDMKQRVPLIPDVYVDFGDESNIKHLVAIHCRSNKHILRGLTANSNDPFLSVLLWNDMDHFQMVPILMVCTFTVDRLDNVTVFGREMEGNRSLITFHPADFGVMDFNKLLVSKSVEFTNAADASALRQLSRWDIMTPWTIGRRRCSNHCGLQWRMSCLNSKCRPCFLVCQAQQRCCLRIPLRVRRTLFFINCVFLIASFIWYEISVLQ